MGLVGWKYKREIQLINTTSFNLENYIVGISLDSSNFDFSKARFDGSDIRFTDSDGVTSLDYYVEDYDYDKQEATIWIKVPLISANQTSSVYMYYGNMNAVSRSDESVITSGFLYDPDPFNDGSCLAFYPFDGDANDYSGNGNNGTEHGTFYWPLGKFRKCCHPASAASDYISIPTITSTPWTISMWMMRTQDFTYYQPVIGHNYWNTHGDSNHDWFFGFYDKYIALRTTRIFLTEINKWYHVVLTYKGNSEFDVYVDREFIKSVSSSRANLNKINQIGGFRAFSSKYVRPCYFDHLHIFNRTLTEDEISLLSTYIPSTMLDEVQVKSRASGVIVDTNGNPIINTPIKIYLLNPDTGHLVDSTDCSTDASWEINNVPAEPGEEVISVFKSNDSSQKLTGASVVVTQEVNE